MTEKQQPQQGQNMQQAQNTKPLTDYEDKPDSVKKHVPVVEDDK